MIVTVTAAAKSQGGASAQSVDPNAPGDYVIPVTINVTDVNEPPAKPAAPTVRSTGNSANTTLHVSWTAPDMTGKPPITDYDVRYHKKGESSWKSHSFTGTGTSTRITGQVGGANYNVQVRATNDEGTSDWSDSGNLKNVDPKLPDNPSRNIAENSTSGTNVGTAVAATDPDSSTLYYTMTGTDAASFEIDGSTGQISLAAGTSPDYEAKTSYSVTVSVSDKLDSEGNADTEIDHTVTVTVNVTDVDEPLGKPGTPTAKTATTNSITVTWTEPDATGKPPVKKYWVKYQEQGNSYGKHLRVLHQRGAAGRVSDEHEPERAAEAGHGLQGLGDGGERRGLRRLVGESDAVHDSIVQRPRAADFAIADAYAHTHTVADTDTHAHTYAHAVAYADTHAIAYTYAHADADTDTDGHAHAIGPAAGHRLQAAAEVEPAGPPRRARAVAPDDRAADRARRDLERPVQRRPAHHQLPPALQDEGHGGLEHGQVDHDRHRPQRPDGRHDLRGPRPRLQRRRARALVCQGQRRDPALPAV